MRLFKNKFFIIALSIALILATSATVLSVMGVTSPLRNVLGTVTLPLRWATSKVAQGVAGFSAYFTEFDRLAEENKEMRDENNRLKQELANAKKLAEENLALREYLNLDILSHNWEIVDAVVISRESGSYMTVYTLNRGSLHGVKNGMAVIVPHGVVGYVRETGLAWCKVVPITETTAAVGAYVEKSGASGLVVGDFSLREANLCKMTYIENGDKLEKGDLVLTSGIGNIYPAGLVIGTIEEILPDDFSRTYIATIKPAADFIDISRVIIITSYSVSVDTMQPPSSDNSPGSQSDTAKDTNGDAP